MANKRVYLNPGHGGSDPGAQANGLVEKTLNLQVASMTRDILQKEYSGVTIGMNRTNDTYDTLGEISRKARAWNADLFCSIHFNAFTSNARTIETFKFPESTASRTAQVNLHNAIKSQLQRHGSVVDRGTKDGNFGVLRGTYKTMLSVLTEAAFLTNTQDANLIKKTGVLAAIARGHAEGIAKTLNLKKSGASANVSAPVKVETPQASFSARFPNLWDKTSDETLEVQKALNLIGYKLKEDGHFGQATLDAVRDAQVKLKVTAPENKSYGVPGPALLAAIRKVVASTVPLYRVRKDSWGNADSQIGAFQSKEAALEVAKANEGFKVFDSNGGIVRQPEEKAPAPKLDTSGYTPIKGKNKATKDQMVEFARNGGAPVDNLSEIAQAFLDEGEKYGVAGDIAFAQSLLETGFFIYKGSAVTHDQNNFCGMGVTENGMKGHSWPTAKAGVKGQIHHLLAYATKDEPKGEETTSPRAKYVQRGVAPHWEQLSMRWAMNENYGTHILKIHEGILQTEPEKETDDNEALWKWIEESELFAGKESEKSTAFAEVIHDMAELLRS